MCSNNHDITIDGCEACVIFGPCPGAWDWPLHIKLILCRILPTWSSKKLFSAFGLIPNCRVDNHASAPPLLHKRVGGISPPALPTVRGPRQFLAHIHVNGLPTINRACAISRHSLWVINIQCTICRTNYILLLQT